MSKKEASHQNTWLSGNSPHYFRFQHYKRLTEGKIQKDHRLLDIGCGEGNLLSILPDCEKYGVDVSEKHLEIGKKNLPRVKFTKAQAEELPFKDNFFDWVFCTEVIEHLKVPEKCIGEVKRVLKQTGHFLLSTYNHFNIFNLLTLKAFSSLPRASWGHTKEYNHLSIIRLLKEKGFRIIRVSQAGNVGSLDKFFRLVPVPIGDFIIVLSKSS